MFFENIFVTPLYVLAITFQLHVYHMEKKKCMHIASPRDMMKRGCVDNSISFKMLVNYANSNLSDKKICETSGNFWFCMPVCLASPCEKE